MHVAASADASEVLARAGEHLASDPVLHNLILTLLHERCEQPEPGRYWLVSDGPRLVGVGFQSPLSFPIALSLMSREAIAELVEAIVSAGIELPGVTADAATAARFAGQWTERRKSAARPVEGLRIYECSEARPPAAARGTLRRALPEDRGLVVAWARGFYADAGELGSHDVAAAVERRLAAGRFWLWEDGGPVSMAAQSGSVAGVVRVLMVYTPPEKRGRGYAGACVARLSQIILEGGSRCMLYTDLSNPTSNSVYRRIGYRAAAEGLRYRFD
jgi:predicted GNAT family acetyltransferase